MPEGGGIILVNTPGFHEGRFVWAWATPFVLRRPFSDTDIDRRFRVLEAPGSYCCLWAQDMPPVVSGLINQPVDSYLIYLDETERLTKTHLPKERVADLLSGTVAVEQGSGAQKVVFKNPEALAGNWEALWKQYAGP